MAKVLDVRDGAEVSVETGLGFVLKVDEPKGRNARVEINAEHLAKSVNSWVDTASTALYDRVRVACQEGRRVEYRVVVKRKRDVADDIPLEQVPSDGRIRDLEWLDFAGGVVSSTSSAPATRPVDENPPPTTRPTPPAARSDAQAPASDDSGANPVRVCGLCDQSVAGGPPTRFVAGVLQHVECPGTPAPVDQAPPGPLPSDAPRGEPTAAKSNGNGPKIAEGRPWEFHNSDGTLNPGSYAYGAAEGIVLLANDLLLARARGIEPFKAPTEPALRGLARRLIRAADRAQAGLRDDGHVARMAASHTRCRSALRAALEVYPPPWGAPADEIDRWEDGLVEHAGVILRLTVELVDPEATS